MQALLYIWGNPTFKKKKTSCVPHRQKVPTEKWGQHANVCGLISSSKIKSKCTEINWLTGNLSSQLEHSFKGSTGRMSVCFTEATYLNLRRSAEMGETRNSSWYLKQFSQKSSYWTTCKCSSRPVELRNSEQMLLSPANLLSPFSPALLPSSELFYIAAELKMLYQIEEMILPKH